MREVAPFHERILSLPPTALYEDVCDVAAATVLYEVVTCETVAKPSMILHSIFIIIVLAAANPSLQGAAAGLPPHAPKRRCLCAGPDCIEGAAGGTEGAVCRCVGVGMGE